MKKINKKGFTLIELLVVVAILGILVSISIVFYSDYKAKARVAKIQTQLKQIPNLVNLYNAKVGEIVVPIFIKNSDDFFEQSKYGKREDIFHLNKPEASTAYALLSEMPSNTPMYYGWDGTYPNLGGKWFVATLGNKGPFCIDYNGSLKFYPLKEDELKRCNEDIEQCLISNAIFEGKPESLTCK